jgi:hypothetical protein
MNGFVKINAKNSTLEWGRQTVANEFANPCLYDERLIHHFNDFQKSYCLIKKT